LDWAVTHGVNTVAGLNDRIRAGEFSQIITESEAAFNVEIESAVNGILARRNELKVVLITGPSSSGKTTTTIKIKEKLQAQGLELVMLNVDNYFFNLDMHPKDEFGDYDFETPHALDLNLINQHLNDLVSGKEIQVPYYDFKIGKRSNETTPMRVRENELILIDSLHGLFPPLTEKIEESTKYKIYLEPLMQMKGFDGEYIQMDRYPAHAANAARCSTSSV
jgi:uridine kinase